MDKKGFLRVGLKTYKLRESLAHSPVEEVTLVHRGRHGGNEERGLVEVLTQKSLSLRHLISSSSFERLGVSDLKTLLSEMK
jgi:hypothetical protein